MPRILIVDDQYAARTTIRELLDWHGFQVVGDAKDGEEAIESAIRLRPDIVVMDINMPGVNGIRAAREIRRLWPATKIVFLTVYDTPALLIGTRPWAHGFVPKSDAGTKLSRSSHASPECPRPTKEYANSERLSAVPCSGTNPRKLGKSLCGLWLLGN